MALLGKLAAVCLLALLAAPLLKRGDMGMLAPLAALLAGALALLTAVQELKGMAERLALLTGLAPALFIPLLKGVGIAVTVRLAGALCADAGQSALKALLEIGGTICALLAAMPLVETFLQLLEAWL